jgi:phosphoglycolate phosphatase
MVGKGSEHLIRSVLAHVGADAARYDAAWDRYQHHYLAVNGQHSDVYAGVAQGLGAARSRPAPGLPDHKPTEFARPLLQAKGLDGYFEVVFGGDAFERKSPTRCRWSRPVKRWARGPRAR